MCSGIVQIESTLFYPFRGQNVPRSPLPLVCKAQTGKQKYLLISDITRSPKYLLCFFRHMQFYFCSKTSLILVFNSKLVGLNDLWLWKTRNLKINIEISKDISHVLFYRTRLIVVLVEKKTRDANIYLYIRWKSNNSLECIDLYQVKFLGEMSRSCTYLYE